MGSPFMQKILLCRKFFYAENFLFFYAENSFMQKIHICRKFFYVENSSLVENSSMQKILLWQKILLCRKLFYFHAENSSMVENSSVQKILLFSCRKFFYAEKFLYWVQSLFHSYIFKKYRLLLKQR